jgi:charged multivesicular body protein 1
MTELGKQYEDIDVMSSVMDTATTQATAKQVPQEVVDRLKRQVADEAGFELRQDLESATPVTKDPVKNAVSAEAEDELQQRLVAMRAGAS